MPSILFVCTANRFRSPLAAAYFRKILEERHDELATSWVVSSAGTWATPGQPVIRAVSIAAQKFGVDLANHRSVSVSRQLLSKNDLILVMQAGQKEALQSEFSFLYERIYLLTTVAGLGSYDIPDSFASEQDVVEISNELYTIIQGGWRQICDLAVALRKQQNTN